MGVHTFPKGICPKVNVIARLEYERAYYDSAVHRFNHYTMRTPPGQLENDFIHSYMHTYIYICVCVCVCVCVAISFVLFFLSFFHFPSFYLLIQCQQIMPIQANSILQKKVRLKQPKDQGDYEQKPSLHMHQLLNEYITSRKKKHVNFAL